MSWGNHNIVGVGDPSSKLGGPGFHSHGMPGLASTLAIRPGVRNPGALAAAIDRRIRSHQAGGAMRVGGR